jgi:hypothetical protein
MTINLTAGNLKNFRDLFPPLQIPVTQHNYVSTAYFSNKKYISVGSKPVLK